MTFDVASVRESAPADSYMVGGGFTSHTGSFRVTSFSIENMLAVAYNVRWDQLANLPECPGAMFNVQASVDDDTNKKMAALPMKEQHLEQEHMLQSLLAERFHLQVHWETRSALVYDLVAMGKGAKMQQGPGAPATEEEKKIFGDRPLPPLVQRGNSAEGFTFVAHGATLANLTEMLSVQMGHPVIDKTGLTGIYSFDLHYHGARLSERRADDMDPIPPMETAIQDQLGLKLETSKGPVPFLVIDHIEKPTPN